MEKFISRRMSESLNRVDLTKITLVLLRLLLVSVWYVQVCTHFIFEYGVISLCFYKRLSYNKKEI
jgi:hypothetical protein